MLTNILSNRPLNTPIISVVIPTYNCAHLLAQTIDSVRSQTMTEWEMLIINDGSTDSTVELVQAYMEKDDRIHLINQSNSGVSRSRNYGASFASSDIIAFLDADDRWLPNKLQDHLEELNMNPNVGISFARVEFITEQGIVTGKTTNCQLHNLTPDRFLYTNPTVTVSNLVIRKSIFELLKGFDETINHSEDMDLLFRASRYVKIEGIDRVLIQYRIQTTSLSSTVDKMEQGWHHLIEKARQLEPELVDQHYSAAYANQLIYLARQTLRLNLVPKLGINYLHRALRIHWPSVLLAPRSVLIAFKLYQRHLNISLKEQVGQRINNPKSSI